MAEVAPMMNRVLTGISLVRSHWADCSALLVRCLSSMQMRCKMGGQVGSINMDTYNNWVGVTLSQESRFTGQSVATAADYALENGCLQRTP